MKLIISRVSSAVLTIDGQITSKIGKGLFCLLGVAPADDEAHADILAKKCASMRIFSDENGKMNLSVADIGGEILVESNFTLYANIKHGNRPDFFGAMEPKRANELYEYFVSKLKESGVPVKTGVFGADMHTDVAMDGPVTIVASSEELIK